MHSMQCVNLTKTIHDLESTQAKLLKTALGLKVSCRTTPLMNSLKIQSVAKSIELCRINVLKSTFSTQSTNIGYLSHVLSDYILDHNLNNNGLLYNCIFVFDKYNVCMIDDISYSSAAKSKLTSFPSPNGITDTVRYLLSSRIPDSHNLVNLLLKSY